MWRAKGKDDDAQESTILPFKDCFSGLNPGHLETRNFMKETEFCWRQITEVCEETCERGKIIADDIHLGFS